MWFLDKIKSITNIVSYLSGSSIYQKCLRWFVISLIAFVGFFIIMLIDGFSGGASLVKLALPNGTIMGPGKHDRICIDKLSNGIFTFNYDIGFYARNHYGKAVGNDIYEDIGQSTEWVYTGYVTNGQKLSIAADGVYFPYGSDITPRDFSTKYVLKQSNGQSIEAIKFEDRYVMCDLNTDLAPSEILDINKIGPNSQHLSRYTYENNINNQNIAMVDYNSIGQSDCVRNLNCKPNSPSHEREYKPCALMDGAGVYVAFGDEPTFAYHLYNMSVPTVTAKCTDNNYVGIAQYANNGISQPAKCEYSYVLDSNKQIVWTKIPMSLPIATFNPVIDYNAIKDLKTVMNQVSLAPVSQSLIETKYKYATYTPANLSNCGGGTPNYVLIGNGCYKVTKDVSIDNAKQQGCSFVSSGFGVAADFYPNELCPPPYGQRIYVKAFNTNYDLSNGLVSLTFLSGARLEEPIGKKKGSLTFLSDILNTILTPLLGAQSEESIKDNTIITYKSNSGNNNIVNGVIQISVKNSYTGNKSFDERLVTSVKNGDIAVQFSKYNSQGILISIPKAPGRAFEFLTYDYDLQNLQSVITQQNANIDMKNLFIIINKNGENNGIKSFQDVKIEYVNNINHDFIKINNIRTGYFVNIRNLILNSYILQLARFLLVIWYVFSFGFGVIRGDKTFSRDQIRDDFFRFSMLIWLTNPGSYEFMDDFVVPVCFRSFLNLATLFQAAGASVMGMSMDLYNPLDFFDNIVSFIFSKEFWAKIYAICFSGYFWLHFLLFPLMCSGFIKMVMSFLKYIFSMIFCIVNFGVILMLFPIICTMSMFSQYESLLKNTLNKIKDEFINLAVSIGLFGMMTGFIVSYFLNAISYRICWESLFDVTVIPLIIEFRFLVWQAKDVEISIILLNAAIFYIVSTTFEILPSFATQFATQLFGGSGGLGMSMAAGGKIFDQLTSLGSSAISYIGERVGFNGAYQTLKQKEMMKKFKEYNDLLGKKVLHNNSLRIGRGGIMTKSEEERLDKLAEELNSYMNKNKNTQFGQMLFNGIAASNQNLQSAYQSHTNSQNQSNQVLQNIAKNQDLLNMIKDARNARKNPPEVNQQNNNNNNNNDNQNQNQVNRNSAVSSVDQDVNNTDQSKPTAYYNKDGDVVLHENGKDVKIDKHVFEDIVKNSENLNDKELEKYLDKKSIELVEDNNKQYNNASTTVFNQVSRNNQQNFKNMSDDWSKSDYVNENKIKSQDSLLDVFKNDDPKTIEEQKMAYENTQKSVEKQQGIAKDVKEYQQNQKGNFTNEESIPDVYSGLKNDKKDDGW